ncbi:MAG: DEAD/DEAH box helicase family protein [Acidobacteria bacterium]|nr:DEAD/DEAH box helicase family protein [Acidobacteriota bacterium]
MASFPELFDSLDPDPNVRGKQFERIVKWWLLHDPVYRSQIKLVWLWDEWPGRWGADAGIDLVAKTADGDLWAIQAKAYSPEYSITKKDVNTFISESGRREFSYRLLVATTNRIGVTALRTLEGQEKPSGLKLASDLNKAELEWPDSPDDLRVLPPVPKDPFPHNQEAVADVVAGFEKVDRGQLIMACGTGKTLVGLWVAEQLDSQRTLVLVPSLSLLAQTLREWTANTRRPFTFLPVCSDETVKGEDHLVSHTTELGMPVTTDPATIAGFLRKRGPSVVFATYQSSGRIAEAYALGRIPKFDLVIADEAHRVAGPVSSDFATVLDPNAIRLAWLAEFTMGSAVYSELDPGDGFATLDLNVRFTRPAVINDGGLTAQGQVRHKGNRLRVSSAEITNSQGKRVAMATSSALIVRGGARALTEGRLPDEILQTVE